MKALSNFIERVWYGPTARYWLVIFLLYPLSLIFCCIAFLRKTLLIQRQEELPVPLIVVGNISVGGTGKTPLLCALAQALIERNLRVGIISRGYGASHQGAARFVSVDDDPRVVGDEPLLIVRTTRCPVVIGRDRLAAARYLLKQHKLDVILSDDGLQHYALPRDVEIAVLDGQRGVGNGFCFPAGPLRESVSRLHAVDFLAINGELPFSQSKRLPAGANTVGLDLFPQSWVSLKSGEVLPLDAVDIKIPVHAVAGIGNPARFFSTLQKMGYSMSEHPFFDHYFFSEDDFVFSDKNPVVMTEKDAVKCALFAQEHWYALRVAMKLSDAWVDAIWSTAQRKHR